MHKVVNCTKTKLLSNFLSVFAFATINRNFIAKVLNIFTTPMFTFLKPPKIFYALCPLILSTNWPVSISVTHAGTKTIFCSNNHPISSNKDSVRMGVHWSLNKPVICIPRSFLLLARMQKWNGIDFFALTHTGRQEFNASRVGCGDVRKRRKKETQKSINPEIKMSLCLISCLQTNVESEPITSFIECWRRQVYCWP